MSGNFSLKVRGIALLPTSNEHYLAFLYYELPCSYCLPNKKVEAILLQEDSSHFRY